MRASGSRLIGFAAGDFAFNLYWQSTTFFLLFFYTDALGMPIRRAAALLLLASIWDGIANLIAGIAADAYQAHAAAGRALAWGALPLGASFALIYLPLGTGAGAFGLLLAANLLFRALYAWLNLSYLAISSRIAVTSRDRALLAGARMLFGTLAGVVVALGTRPLGGWIVGRPDGREFAIAAWLFGAVGAGMLGLIGFRFRGMPAPIDEGGRNPVQLARAVVRLLGDRAFLTLNLAMMAMVVAVTVLGKSTLYFFKYVLGDLDSGQLTIALMSIVAAIALPVWTALARRLGGRLIWLIAAALAIAQLVAFALGGVRDPALMALFLVGLQCAIGGLHLAFWALLPDTIEFGQTRTGVRLEASVFGLSALLQRVSIGVATAILGWRMAGAGYQPNRVQDVATLASLRWTVAAVPLAFLALSCGLILASPLRRGAHDRLLRARGG